MKSSATTGVQLRPTYRPYRTATHMKILVLSLIFFTSLIATGCSRSAAETHHDHKRDVRPAASYKAGHGIQLTPVGAAAIELKAADVTTREIGGAAAAPAIPAEALLRTIKGDFVYVSNGDWFLRTPVTVGAFDGKWYEIKDGLYEGDRIVVNGTRAIWLAELQAVNGGVGCADDN